MGSNERAWPLPAEILPQRPPLLLIDEIIDCGPRSLTARRFINADDSCLQGHFPGKPVVPAAYLLEMMAQASAAFERLRYQSGDTVPCPGAVPEPGLFAGADKVRFYMQVTPGANLIIETQLQQRLGRLARFTASIRQDDERVATAQLILAAPRSVSLQCPSTVSPGETR